MNPIPQIGVIRGRLIRIGGHKYEYIREVEILVAQCKNRYNRVISLELYKKLDALYLFI